MKLWLFGVGVGAWFGVERVLVEVARFGLKVEHELG